MPNWRNQHMGKTHCIKGHEFSPSNTYTYETDTGKQRKCKRCTLDRQSRRRMNVNVGSNSIRKVLHDELS